MTITTSSRCARPTERCLLIRLLTPLSLVPDIWLTRWFSTSIGSAHRIRVLQSGVSVRRDRRLRRRRRAATCSGATRSPVQSTNGGLPTVNGSSRSTSARTVRTGRSQASETLTATAPTTCSGAIPPTGNSKSGPCPAGSGRKRKISGPSAQIGTCLASGISRATARATSCCRTTRPDRSSRGRCSMATFQA